MILQRIFKMRLQTEINVLQSYNIATLSYYVVYNGGFTKINDSCYHMTTEHNRFNYFKNVYRWSLNQIPLHMSSLPALSTHYCISKVMGYAMSVAYYKVQGENCTEICRMFQSVLFALIYRVQELSSIEVTSDTNFQSTFVYSHVSFFSTYSYRNCNFKMFLLVPFFG